MSNKKQIKRIVQFAVESDGTTPLFVVIEKMITYAKTLMDVTDIEIYLNPIDTPNGFMLSFDAELDGFNFDGPTIILQFPDVEIFDLTVT